MLHLSENLRKYRILKNLTQEDVAEYLGITPQSVSKWERGESVPDVYVLKNIADIFDVTVDYILVPHQLNEKVATKKETARRNHMLISSISIIGVLLLATVAFTAVWSATQQAMWIIFIDSLPICFIVLLVLNSLWFKKRNNLFIISLLIWSLLLGLYLTLLVAGVGNYWLVFVIGIPAQIVTALCFGIKISKRNKKKKQK